MESTRVRRLSSLGAAAVTVGALVTPTTLESPAVAGSDSIVVEQGLGTESQSRIRVIGTDDSETYRARAQLDAETMLVDVVLTFISSDSAPADVVVRHPRCEQTAPGEVTCRQEPIRAYLGGGRDRWRSTSSLPREERENHAIIHGGSGPDRLRVSGAGKGTDLWGDRGADRLIGDLVGGFRFGSRAWGGLGADEIQGAHTADGGGGDDLLVGSSGPDRLKGRGGDDRLRADSARDRISGGMGSDVMWGGPGGDRVMGHRGDDVLHTAEELPESDGVFCGAGADLTFSDATDVRHDCERSGE